MRMAATISRYALGFLFTVIGLNGFLQFLPAPPLPPLAGQFLGVLIASHFMVPIFLLQIVCGLMFFVNRWVPLALTMIAPVIVNILLYHMLMNPAGIVPGLIAAICWWLVFLRVRPAFDGILQNRRQEATN
jgi:putative oxidoreductase